MAHESKDNSNNDILDDSAEREQAIQHHTNLANKLTDSFLRDTKDPADTSRREQLMALLKKPNIQPEDLRMELGNLLQNETFGTKTREIITNYLTKSPVSSLPGDVIRTSIGRKLEKKDRAAFSAASLGLFNTFFGRLGLLKLVTNGSETSARLLLKRAPESSVLKKGAVSDPGGRTFENISSLQYAYWMNDWYMVDMLLKNLPEEYLAEAQKQINEIKRYDSEGNPDLENQKGIEYQLYLDIDATVEEKDFAVQHLAPVILPQENVEYTISLPPDDYDYTKAIPIPEGKRRVLVTVKGEQHYSYQPLIKALKAYLPIYQQWEASGFNDNNLEEQVIYHWCKIVGLVQRYATAFLAQQYCHPDRSFEKVKFDEPEFKNRSLNIYNNVTQQLTSWFLRASGLGDSFGIFRGRAEGRAASRWWCRLTRDGGWLEVDDLAAIERLCEVSPEKMASVLDKHFAELSQTMRPQ